MAIKVFSPTTLVLIILSFLSGCDYIVNLSVKLIRSAYTSLVYKRNYY